MVPNGDLIAVHKGAVHVDGYIVSKINVTPIITQERLAHRDICANAAK